MVCAPDDSPATPQRPSLGTDRPEAENASSRQRSSAEAAVQLSPSSTPVASARLGPDVGTGDPTDGRQRFDWRSHYPDDARTQIRWEAYYVVALLFLSLVLIFASWRGVIADVLSVSGDPAATLKKFAIYTFSGLLGGAVFGIKYLYRVVARGYWHVDRKLWRYLSPLNSSALAFVMGAAVEAGFVSVDAASSTKGVVAFGFLVGYFADQAISKLHEIATAMFGTATKSRE